MAKRGRPPITIVDPNEKPRKFSRTYKDNEGTYIWTYNLDIFPNGPISVESIYNKEYSKQLRNIENDTNENLPLTKRTWTNPKNGKEVSYQRAKQLKLI